MKEANNEKPYGTHPLCARTVSFLRSLLYGNLRQVI